MFYIRVPTVRFNRHHAPVLSTCFPSSQITSSSVLPMTVILHIIGGTTGHSPEYRQKPRTVYIQTNGIGPPLARLLAMGNNLQWPSNETPSLFQTHWCHIDCVDCPRAISSACDHGLLAKPHPTEPTHAKVICLINLSYHHIFLISNMRYGY